MIEGQQDGAAKEELSKVLDNAERHVNDLDAHIVQGKNLVESKKKALKELDPKFEEKDKSMAQVKSKETQKNGKYSDAGEGESNNEAKDMAQSLMKSAQDKKDKEIEMKESADKAAKSEKLAKQEQAEKAESEKKEKAEAENQKKEQQEKAEKAEVEKKEQ